MTEWRPCFGYPEYEISEFGAVRRISTSSQGAWKAGSILKGKFWPQKQGNASAAAA
jgi:hypothetical protein